MAANSEVFSVVVMDNPCSTLGDSTIVGASERYCSISIFMPKHPIMSEIKRIISVDLIYGKDIESSWTRSICTILNSTASTEPASSNCAVKSPSTSNSNGLVDFSIVTEVSDIGFDMGMRSSGVVTIRVVHPCGAAITEDVPRCSGGNGYVG